MDQLTAARNCASAANDPTMPVENETRIFFAQLGILHSLIALCERIDAVTGTPANTKEKSIRVINKPA